MGLVLPFDTDDPEFTRGVEVGIVYADLSRLLPTEVTHYERMIHTSNLEMLPRIADADGWSLRAEACTDDHGYGYDEWTTVVLERLRLPADPETPEP